MVIPYTTSEREPFTSDPEAREAVDNLFCKGRVADDEAAPGFCGWVCCWIRPLSLGSKPPLDKCLMYGNGATVFSYYAAAIAASVYTLRYAKENNYEWFREGGIRIFSLVKK